MSSLTDMSKCVFPPRGISSGKCVFIKVGKHIFSDITILGTIYIRINIIDVSVCNVKITVFYLLKVIIVVQKKNNY